MIQKYIYVFGLTSFLWSACGNKEAIAPEETSLEIKADSIPTSASDISKSAEGEPRCEIIPAAEGTWGYIVEVNGQKIRQTTIPGMPGKLGFKKKEDAEATASLVCRKMKAGLFPPVITFHELDSLRILK